MHCSAPKFKNETRGIVLRQWKKAKLPELRSTTRTTAINGSSNAGVTRVSKHFFEKHPQQGLFDQTANELARLFKTAIRANAQPMTDAAATQELRQKDPLANTRDSSTHRTIDEAAIGIVGEEFESRNR
ncbi:hypothetical protein TNCV_4934721 [Trichonephila clavipes]|nr:hypothetical protein TNCV_4934721 [Trichonephila clavipes]